ncbi:MAG: hypothetical protein MJZ88_04100 [Paludibacteraceae bacterium]|nr:hypothetical protein [Paludibacteraceae bacterium]
MKKHTIILIGIAGCLISCQPQSGPTRRVTTIDTVFTTAYSEFYGAHYQLLHRNVLSLDLYSQGLTFDSLGKINGQGTNLYLSDIFIPLEDSTLRSCTYTVDTTGQNFTTLPGMNIDGGVTGAYLLLVNTDNTDPVSKIYYFTSGTFTIQHEGDTTDIDFHLVTEDKQTFDATYRGVIQTK